MNETPNETARNCHSQLVLGVGTSLAADQINILERGQWIQRIGCFRLAQLLVDIVLPTEMTWSPTDWCLCQRLVEKRFFFNCSKSVATM